MALAIAGGGVLVAIGGYLIGASLLLGGIATGLVLMTLSAILTAVRDTAETTQPRSVPADKTKLDTSE
jgi:hypothetical protein